MTGVTSEKVADEQQTSLDRIMTMIFKRAWPVWVRYDGDVPSDELRKFDEEGDFPGGVAAAAMTRLSRDKELREQIRDLSLRARGRRVRNEKRSRDHK